MFNVSKPEQVCPHCQTRVAAGARFCPHCGGQLPGGGTVTCPRCGKPFSSGARFCPYCGVDLAAAAAPPLVSQRWEKIQGAFATRVEVEDLPGLLRKELIIEPGTNAILLIDGANQGTIGPGRWTLQTLLDGFGWAAILQSAPRATAILTDIGDVELPFDVNDLWTADPLPATLHCRVVVRLERPLDFLTNVMKGQRSFPLSELRAMLYPELADIARSWLERHTAQELSQAPQLKALVEQALQMGLERTFEQVGLRFVQLRAVGISSQPVEHARQLREALVIAQYETDAAVDQRAAELARRKRLFEATNADELQDIAETEARLKTSRERAALLSQLQQVALSTRLDEVRNQEEFEAALREVDKRKLLRETDWEELRRSIGWQREDLLSKREWDVADRQAARSHALARLEIDRQYELKQAELVLRTDYEQARVDFELEMERKRLDGQLELERKRWQAELERRVKEADLRREQTRLDDIARQQKELEDAQTANQVALERARTDLERTRLRAEQDRIDGELGILMLEKMKALKRKDEEEREALRLKVKREEMDLELRTQAQRHQQEMERTRAQYEQERLLIEQKAKLAPEQLIAISPVEQARFITELRQTELMKGMSADEILARVAERSPEAARALGERAQALAQSDRARADELKQLYERLVTHAEQTARTREEAAQQAARMVQETAHKALDSQREGMVEVARAVGHGQPPSVIVAGAGTPGMVAAPGATLAAPGGEVVICPHCHARAAAGTKFCQNCGYRFFE